ncbi:MAG: HlyD family efflux transporter periplasmic adaptor subunit [Calothrix sp. FI2-JRJ7]|jgi:HlyD family secretion protein|nr:HlyD family efflux transporter periplasmic adaptor subunit [Calothrix sp. FI2-JRJ7]
MNLKSLSKSSSQWLLGLFIAVTAVTGAIVLIGMEEFRLESKNSSQPVKTVPVVKEVTALGRLQPQKEVIRLSSPLALNEDRVAQLLVKEGDSVQKGQVVAILDSRNRLQSAVLEAQNRVKEAKVRLAQVKAGAKKGEIQAQQAIINRLQAERNGNIAIQKANITRLQSEVRNARSEYKRNLWLHQQGAISASALDSKRLAAETAAAQMEQAIAQQKSTAKSLTAQEKEAIATLNRIVEIRPVEVETAQTQVGTAIAQLQRAKIELEQAYIKAPMASQIFKIYAKTGEKLGDNGIADLGQTDSMMVVAEIYQTDIDKVRIGQSVTITSSVFPGKLQGKVDLVGLRLSRQNVFSNQPGENLDRRVVEVKINLTKEASRQVASLTDLQVEVAIQI